MILDGLFSLLCNDYGWIKFFFTLLCLYLIFEESYDAFVERPTLTSTKKENMTKEDFPVITICPDPSVNLQHLKSIGFKDLWDYKSGRVDNTELKRLNFGWTGNTTDDVKNILESLSVFKSSEDCPFVWLEYLDPGDSNKILQGVAAETELKFALHPFHICCRVIVPSIGKDNSIRDVYIFQGNQSIKVLLSDKSSSSIFTQSNKNIIGEPIKAKRYRSPSYSIKIFQEINLPNSPNFECVEYKRADDYDQCLKTRIVSDTLAMVNCTPPWLTEDEALWCQDEHWFSSTESMKQFSDHLISLNFKPSLGLARISSGP